MLSDYYVLEPGFSDLKRLSKEREKARKLKKSSWWLAKKNQGSCHYCQRKFAPAKLTMDHIVPLARGGASTRGNIVPSCLECNRDKKLHTPVDRIIELGKNKG